MFDRSVWGLWTLWLVLAGSCFDRSAGLRPIRSLTQSANCPVENCDASNSGNCIWQQGAWTCTQCSPGFVRSSDGRACVCPAGTYLTASGRCRDCIENHYCPRGQNPIACPNKLVTRGTGARRIWNCVNPPGYSYFITATGTPTAVPCGPNTYSIGYTRNRECNPCPSGSKTDPQAIQGSQTSSSACKVPPGYVFATDAAVPCSKGTFSSSYADAAARRSCTSCADARTPGLTTAGTAANQETDCYFVEPGYVPVDFRGQVRLTNPIGSRFEIVRARSCPQNYYCVGGDPTGSTQIARPCTNGRRTEGEGAASEEQCVCAPGWFWDGSSCSECPSGTYKEGWNMATTCTACRGGAYDQGVGVDGWESDKTMLIPQLDPHNSRVVSRLAVRGNSSSCYIDQGWGSVVYYDASVPAGRIKAFKCPTNFYSKHSARVYGVKSTPCQACPPNQVTSCVGLVNTYGAQAACIVQLDTVADAAGGGLYIGARSQAACVHAPGYGWSQITWDAGVYGRQSGTYSVPCPIGTTNSGGNNGTCTACPVGTTTTVPGQYPCL